MEMRNEGNEEMRNEGNEEMRNEEMRNGNEK